MRWHGPGYNEMSPMLRDFLLNDISFELMTRINEFAHKWHRYEGSQLLGGGGQLHVTLSHYGVHGRLLVEIVDGLSRIPPNQTIVAALLLDQFPNLHDTLIPRISHTKHMESNRVEIVFNTFSLMPPGWNVRDTPPRFSRTGELMSGPINTQGRTIHTSEHGNRYYEVGGTRYLLPPALPMRDEDRFRAEFLCLPHRPESPARLESPTRLRPEPLRFLSEREPTPEPAKIIITGEPRRERQVVL